MSCNVEGIKSYYRYRWLDHSGPTAVLHFEGQTVPHANIGQPPSALSLETAICICIVMASSLHLHLLNPFAQLEDSPLRLGQIRCFVACRGPCHVLACLGGHGVLSQFMLILCKMAQTRPNRPNQSVGMFWNVLESESERKWKRWTSLQFSYNRSRVWIHGRRIVEE